MELDPCPVCFENYDLLSKKPLKLNCPHSLCYECGDELFQREGVVKCPLCTCDSLVNESVEELIDHQALRTFEVHCCIHPSKMELDPCPVCFENYDLLSKKPLKFNCPHRLCCECGDELFRAEGVVKCPLCTSETLVNESVEELIDHQALRTFEVHCCIHPSKLATVIDNTYFLAYCDCIDNQDNCSPITKQGFLYQELTSFLRHYKKQLSKEVKKEYFDSVKTWSNRTRYEKLHWVMDYLMPLENTKCSNHPNKAACSVDLETMKFLCSDCGGPRIYLNQTEQIQQEITQKLRETATVFIRSFYLSNWRSELKKAIKEAEMMIQVKKSSTPNKAVDFYSGCLKCGEYFGSGLKTPVKFNCEHLLCYQCCSEGGSCPLDNSTATSEVSKVFFESLCTCSKKFTSENLPWKLPCTHWVCKHCISQVDQNFECKQCGFQLSREWKFKPDSRMTELIENSELLCCNDFKIGTKVSVDSNSHEVYCNECASGRCVSLVSQYGIFMHQNERICSKFQINTLSNQYFAKDFVILSAQEKYVLRRICLDEIMCHPIKRFTKVFPPNINSQKVWRVYDNQTESILFQATTDAFLWGIYLAGPVSGTKSKFTLKVYSDHELVSVESTISKKEELVTFKQVQIRRGNQYLLQVMYQPGFYYNGAPSYRQRLTFSEQELIIQRANSGYENGRNDHGGPILGFYLLTF